MTPPPNWIEASLGDIARTQLGKMLSAKARQSQSPRPYLRNKNVQWARFDLDNVAEMDFAEEEFERFRVLPGDLLVCEGGEVGRAAVWHGPIAEVAFQKALHRVRPGGGISPEFVLYALMWMAQNGSFGGSVSGSTISHLPQEDLRQLQVPVPPMGEQRRIVAAIEEQLSRLDASQASLGSAKRRLAALRDRVLQPIPEGDWPLVPLSQILISLRNGVFFSRPSTEPPGTAILRISAVRPLALDPGDIRFAPVDESELTQHHLDEGDLLFTRYSGNPEYVGACAAVPRLSRPTLYPDKLIRAVVDRGQAEPAYVALACSAGPTRDAIRVRRKTTAGQVGIAGSQLKSVPLPLPPLDHQRRIVAEAERQLSLVDSLRGAILRSERRSAGLRRAILQKAFQGELVPQDPSDEPASVLLDRIRGS